MRIAQVAPLMESVPPRLYGGTERVVSYLSEELVRQGHDVTLFASGDSKTSANLIRCSDIALRLNPTIKDALPYHLMMLNEVCRQADCFDVIHFHIDLRVRRPHTDYLARPPRPSRPQALLCRLS
jgi:glycosyltransferase involved in cell wall biosynthesis